MGSIPGLQGWFNLCTSTDVVNTSRERKTIHPIISIDAERAFDRIQQLFLMGGWKLNKLAIEKTHSLPYQEYVCRRHDPCREVIIIIGIPQNVEKLIQ